MDEKSESTETSVDNIAEEILSSESSDTFLHKLKSDKSKNIKRRLFSIDDNNRGDVEEKIDKEEIDSDQLPSNSISKNVQSEQDKESISVKDIQSKNNKSKSGSSSKKKNKKKSESKSREDEQNTTSQNTINDVSEMFGEESLSENNQLKSKSFELKTNENIILKERNCHSLDSFVKFTNKNLSEEEQEENITPKHSIEKNSIEISLNLLNSESDIKSYAEEDNQTLHESNPDFSSVAADKDEEEEEEEEDMNVFKEKILSTNKSEEINKIISFEENDNKKITIKQMEQIQTDFEKEILEDITEETEKNSLTQSDSQNQNMENKTEELENTISTKNHSLNSLHVNLDAAQRRDLFANKIEHDSFKDIPPSGRESTSLATTTSTEYKPIQDDLGNKMIEFHLEISQKNTVIERLTESLEQSMKIREQLQQQSDQLSIEVQQLRKQLTETLDVIRKPSWPRDQESTGQRLSEISIDLVSESDEDLDRQILLDDDKNSTSNQNIREKQFGNEGGGGIEIYDPEIQPISKQIEQFKKYLNPEELRIFFMVQKKFDDLLSQEIEKTKLKFDSELKTLNEQLELEKHDKDLEINRIRQLLANVKSGSSDLIELRQELETIHSHEMEKLRMYFEKKCADLEKQYSEEIFSQKSARDDSINSGSDLSEHENLLEESQKISSKEGSPKKKTRKELYCSPSHRQIIPGGEIDNLCDSNSLATIGNLRAFYQEKIQDIKNNYEAIIGRQNEKIKYYETRYADDDFMKKKSLSPSTIKYKDELGQGTVSSYIIIDEDEAINESQEIRTIAAEYERRLEEQIALAKEDILHELENQIQNLLSETTPDDQHWPSELILLREKFTAKNQLEIAQLKIKHEEEMSRLKADYEKQLNRKFKRNSNFDLSRDLEQIFNEKENLRELSSTFHGVLCELIKCVKTYEHDISGNNFNEQQNYLTISPQKIENDEKYEILSSDNSLQLNQSFQMNISKQMKYIPDVSGLLTVIEDPKLIKYVTNDSNSETCSFDLKDCLDKLKCEANYLLKLSENLNKNNKEIEEGNEKNDSCEEDGLKTSINRTPKKVERAHSFNEKILQNHPKDQENNSQERQKITYSLPSDFQNQRISSNENLLLLPSNSIGEMNVLQVHELKNRLVKSESDRQRLQQELEIAIKRNNELGQELNNLKEQLEQLELQKEEYSEGYSIGNIKSPQRVRTELSSSSFTQLQEKARNFLSTPTKNMTENSQLLLHMIEEFCREGDKVVDQGRKEKDDLQAQIDAADKQLKSIRQFLDDQAAERELERDDFLKEIEKLKNQIRERDKEKNSFEVASKSVEQMEHQIKELTQQINEMESKKDKLEIELKASIDKIFVLREIISELETQVETKSLNEHVLNEKVKDLELFIASQTRSNEELQNQVDNLKLQIDQGYQEKINYLEEQLRNSRLSADQILTWNQITEQLRDIEVTLEQKIKTLESLHHSVCSISCSTSPIEDVSVQDRIKRNPIVSPQQSPINDNSPRSSSLLHGIPTDEIQRVYEKLEKHTRVEEAAIKRIKDLEMQIVNIRTNFAELQHERDVLQEKMSEQLQRISVLQSKLDEQRHHVEELQRQSKSDLTIRIHDLQNEVHALNETLSVRDKQILNLKKQLEQSKLIIERQEAELAVGIQSERSSFEKLKSELKMKTDENNKLKEKMKTEMINKLALPDLMETMLADKNEEIDHLKEQLETKEKKLQGILEINLNQPASSASDNKVKTSQEDIETNKSSARTLSDIHSISEYDEPEAVRRAPLENVSSFVLPEVPQLSGQIQYDSTNHAFENIKEIRLNANELNQSPKRGGGVQVSGAESHYFRQTSIEKNEIGNNSSLVPRRINFSDFKDDDSKAKSLASNIEGSMECDEVKLLNAKLKETEELAESLKISKEAIENEKNSEIEKLKINLQEQGEVLDNLQKERNELVMKIEELNKKLEIYLKLKQELTDKDCELLELQKQFSITKESFDKIENDLKNKNVELNDLKDKNEKLNEFNQKLEEKLKITTNNFEDRIGDLENKITNLNDVIQEKNEILTKQDKDLFNLKQNEEKLLEKISKYEIEIQNMKKSNVDSLKFELNMIKTELSENLLLYQKCLLDIQSYQKEIEGLKNQLKGKEILINTLSNGNLKTNQQLSLNEIENQLHEEKQRNYELEQKISYLENELDRLRSQNSDNSKPYSVDEIAEKVEKELNYSAQLDSNIIKAIRNDDGNNLDLKTDHEKLIERDLLNQIQLLKNELDNERKKIIKFQKELNDEKRHSQEIQQQDAEIIHALRIRLEDALKKEENFHKILDEERLKCERLSTQLTVLQRNESRKINIKSPPESPRKTLKDIDLELSERLKTEIKLLTAQNERERERVTDLQRVLEREKIRFETELNDRINYTEKLKKEMEKLLHEKNLAENHSEHLEERLNLASNEIESLESRISSLQEAETRRAHRRGKERIENTQNTIEIQELKTKITNLELERNNLNQLITTLRSDIEKGCQRETKLTEILTNSYGENILPEQFMQKIKEINYLLIENTKENRQMTETIKYLTDERKALQKKIEHLEMNNQNGNVMATNLIEMEERANHLFGRYLRVESHRKALVHQKRYLLIVLQTYQENEMKTLALLNVNVPKKSKKKLFKSVALVIVAIQRMKFIVRRWQVGKRIVSKSIFHVQPQKRATLPMTYNGLPLTSTSPPCRDRPSMSNRINYLGSQLEPLHAPGIISDFTEKS